MTLCVLWKKYCQSNLEESEMAYTVFSRNVNFGARKGLEGPFHYPNGRVLYYDA
jgi:hypothetical protein